MASKETSVEVRASSCYFGLMKTIAHLLTVVLLFTSLGVSAVDFTQIEKDLHGQGVVGWIHGSVADRNLYVFTYRNPNDFFDFAEMSLVSFDPQMLAKLATFSRHDEVRVKGSFLENPSPQKHIEVASIELVKKFKSPYPSDPYQHVAKIPDDLLHLNTATFLVHAVGGDGHILVVEYKDQVLPVFVHNAALAKDLYRNDIVQLKFKIQSYPHEPTHLNLDEAAPNPVTVVDSIQKLHGKPADVTGALIFFPKSPEIAFNVFAVQQLLPNDLNRQFTIVGAGNDMDLFKKILAKLQAAWDSHKGQYVNGRNKLVSTKIQVRVKGIFNEIDPGQANAQIFVKQADDITVSEAR